MIGTRKVIDMATNVAIILVCGLLFWSYFTHKTIRFWDRPEAEQSTHLKGITLTPLTNYSWASHSETLLLAIRVGCHYCEVSLPFYKQLSDLETRKSLRPHLLVVMPDDSELGTELLRSNHMSVEARFRQRLDSIHVSGTPTLLLVNSRGLIEQAWVGQLPPSSEEEVLASAEQ